MVLPIPKAIVNLTLADRLIVFRLALIPLCLIFLLTGFFGLAAVTFLLLACWDQIEIYLAQRRKIKIDLGKKLDPMADKILVISTLIGLTGLGKANAAAVIILCVRELLVAKFCTRYNSPARPLSKWGNIIQIIAVFMLMLHLPLAGGLLWLVVILSSITGGAYLWQSNLLKQLKSS